MADQLGNAGRRALRHQKSTVQVGQNYKSLSRLKSRGKVTISISLLNGGTRQLFHPVVFIHEERTKL